MAIRRNMAHKRCLELRDQVQALVSNLNNPSKDVSDYHWSDDAQRLAHTLEGVVATLEGLSEGDY